MLKPSLRSGELEHSIPDVHFNVDRAVNPFPGLRPFSLDECHLFFGREGQVDEILVKLSHNRFVTVMGYSGSGKSSLMYCGLVPVLYGGFMTETGPFWNVIVSRPGTAPIANLADSIIDFLILQGKIKSSDREIHFAIISSVLRSGANGLIEITRYLQTQQTENVFFLIDQFEELFRYRDNVADESAHDEAQQYVNLMLTAVQQTKVPVYMALTMRSDFIGNCSVFPGLTHLINNSNYLVPQMGREQKRIAIEGPIAVAGGKISSRLIKRLLTDMGNDQDMLPILQHALMRTWDYWTENHEPGEVMDLRHYNAVGKITQALSQHANEAYDELTSREKEIAEILFKNITEKNQENKGLRRPGKLGLITALAEANEEDVIKVVDHFRKAGRSFLMPAAHIPLNSDSIIELSHESLMRIWNRLDAWVEEEFESAQMYKRLSEAAAMYQIGKTGLWRPPDLQLALNWQKKQKPTREWAHRYDEAFERAIVFLDTSRITYEAELKNQEMLQRRVLRRTRATAIILGIAAVIAILFFVFAYIQKIAADEQTIIAEKAKVEAIEQSKIAVVNKTKAEEQAKIAQQKSKEALLANEKLAQALIEAQAAKEATEDALKVATFQQTIAEKQTGVAKEALQKFGVQYERAEINFKEANRLYMLAIAQNLATKSVQEDDDENLAGLLAMQGYHFHRRYDGKKYDPYVYKGLYSALTKLYGTSYNGMKTIGPSHNHLKSLVVSSKKNGFYASGADGRIFIGDYIQVANSPTNYYTPYPSKVIAVNKDESYLINGSDSSFVQIYNLNTTDRKPVVVKGLKGATNDIEVMPDNTGFILASGGKVLSFIDPKAGTSREIKAFPFEIKTISISPDASIMACGTWSGQVLIVNMQDYSYSILFDDPSNRILSVKFSPDGRTLAYGTDDLTNKRGLVRLYNFKTKETRQFTGHRAGVYDVEFSPDGKLLASAGSDKRLQMWVLENPEDLPVVMENNNGFIWDISFAKGSDYLLASCSESEIRVWPTDPSLLAQRICPKLNRNMTPDEWKKYVGSQIEFETTCVVGGLIKDY
jgi:WD40 repeat protein